MAPASVIAGATSAASGLPRRPVQLLERREAGLVGHLPAAGDPVAEIDERQAERARALDVPEDDEGAKRARRRLRREELVDPGQAGAERDRSG